MKTALKIIGGILGAIVAAVAIFYFGWLSPPSPEAVCDNVERIAKDDIKKEAGVDAKGATDELRADCMQRASKEPEFGRAIWVKRLKCMRDADDMNGLKACDDIKTM